MLPFSERGRKGVNMAKYFMIGTKYESFERMMMSADRRGRDDGEQDDTPAPANESSREVMK